MQVVRILMGMLVRVSHRCHLLATQATNWHTVMTGFPRLMKARLRAAERYFLTWVRSPFSSTSDASPESVLSRAWFHV